MFNTDSNLVKVWFIGFFSQGVFSNQSMMQVLD